MALVEMILPKMGESIIEATVLRWLKKEGDKIDKDESVLEVATDKVDTEVPSISAGILSKILIKEGEVAKVGHPLAIIETNISQVSATSVSQVPQEVKVPFTEIHEKEEIRLSAPVSVQDVSQPIGGNSNRFYSPLVLNIAREENISMQELELIPGTGKENRVTKYDILEYVKNKASQKVESISTPVSPIQEAQAPIENIPTLKETKEHHYQTKAVIPTEYVKKPAYSFNGEFEIQEMDRMRRMIAERMIDSQKISATVTSFVEADVTNMVIWRGKVKHEFMRREGEGITFTPIFVEAVVKALKDFPLLNSSIDGDKIIIKKYINIGIAVALNDGNLIVPVLKNADRYNIIGLTKAVNELVKKAKAGKLTPDDVSDGTYSISNVGSFGNVMGTPIIVQPQVGIMALGTIKKKPVVLESEHGDTIGIRHLMFLSHSYDHRIIDGALGGSFVKRVSDYLEQFDVHRKL